MLINIQVLRGLAALVVALLHASSSSKDFNESFGKHDVFVSALAEFFSWFGQAGVDVFFGISGFIILTVALDTTNGHKTDASRALSFFLRRLCRIYPLYWIVLLFAVGSTGEIQSILARPDAVFLVAPPSRYSEVQTAWSLTYELYFYSIVAVGLMMLRDRLVLFIFSWTAAELIYVVAVRIGGAPDLLANLTGLEMFSDPILFEFSAGCGVAVLVQHRIDRFARIALPLAVIALSIGAFAWSRYLFIAMAPQVGGAWAAFEWQRFLTWGVGSALLIYGLIGIERRGSIVLPKLKPLGDMSYSLYLWHVPVYRTAEWVGARMHAYDYIPPALVPAVWIVLALAVSVVSYNFIELPIVKLAKQKLRHDRDLSRAAPSLSRSALVLPEV